MGTVDTDGLAEIRDQLWAEAVWFLNVCGQHPELPREIWEALAPSSGAPIAALGPSPGASVAELGRTCGYRELEYRCLYRPYWRTLRERAH